MRASTIDSLIVQHSGIKSSNEIAEMTGLTPDEVERRRQEIFDRIELSKHELYMKALFQLQEIVSQQQDALKGAAPEDVARLGNTAAGAIGRSVKLVQDLESMANKDTSERDASYARSLVMLVELATYGLLEYVTEQYPEIEPEPLKAKFGELLNSAALEIQA